MNNEIVHQCESLGQMETHEVVCLLVELAREVSDVIGEKGAISVFHQAGKQVGKRLGKESGKGAEDDAREVALHFFRRKSFMESICVNKDNEAEVQGCKIGLVLQDEGLTPGAHPLCRFAFGLIEGAVKSVADEKIHVKHISSEFHASGLTCKEMWN